MFKCQKKGHYAKDSKSEAVQSSGAASGGEFHGFFVHDMSMPEQLTNEVLQSSSIYSTARHENGDENMHSSCSESAICSSRVFEPHTWFVACFGNDANSRVVEQSAVSGACNSKPRSRIASLCTGVRRCQTFFLQLDCQRFKFVILP